MIVPPSVLFYFWVTCLWLYFENTVSKHFFNLYDLLWIPIPQFWKLIEAFLRQVFYMFLNMFAWINTMCFVYKQWNYQEAPPPLHSNSYKNLSLQVLTTVFLLNVFIFFLQILSPDLILLFQYTEHKFCIIGAKLCDVSLILSMLILPWFSNIKGSNPFYTTAAGLKNPNLYSGRRSGFH